MIIINKINIFTVKIVTFIVFRNLTCKILLVSHRLVTPTSLFQQVCQDHPTSKQMTPLRLQRIIPNHKGKKLFVNNLRLWCLSYFKGSLLTVGQSLW